MSTDEQRPAVPAAQVFRNLTIAPIPEGSAVEAAFVLIKLTDGDWCARSVGDAYNRVEMLGQLTAYTQSLTLDEARGWFEDDDPQT